MLDRVPKASAGGAEGAERSEDAAGSGRRADHFPDAGQAPVQRHGPGGAHSREEGPFPQTRGVPGHQPGKGLFKIPFLQVLILVLSAPIPGADTSVNNNLYFN